MKWKEPKDKDKIFLLPTDTIYGLHARAFDEESVKKISSLKMRPAGKSFIVLISNIEDLKKFDIALTDRVKDFLSKIWPGPYSVLLEKQDCSAFQHISTSCKIAFRMPNKKELLEFIEKTGPLVSSSANISGKTHAACFSEAFEIFKDNIDYYVDEGCLNNEPSLVIDLLRI